MHTHTHTHTHTHPSPKPKLLYKSVGTFDTKDLQLECWCGSQSNTVYHNVYQSNTPPTSSVIATFQGQQGAERLQKDNYLVVTGRLFAKHVFMSTLSHVFCLSTHIVSVLFTKKPFSQHDRNNALIKRKGRTVIFTAMIENTVEYVATKIAGGRDRQEMRQFRVLLPTLPSKLLNPLQHVIFFAPMASLLINIKMTLTTRNEKSRQS